VEDLYTNPTSYPRLAVIFSQNLASPAFVAKRQAFAKVRVLKQTTSVYVLCTGEKDTDACQCDLPGG
jgi:hypothetical protein